MKLGKPIKTPFKDEDTYVMFDELPDGSLLISGLRRDVASEFPGTYSVERVRFTKAAVQIIHDFCGHWLKGDFAE